MIISLEMSISPNALIAREDGQEDWLSSANWQDFLKRAKEANNIVMGRETYELVTKLYPDYNFGDVDCELKIIVSKSMQEVPAGYVLVKSPEEAIEMVKTKSMTELLLIGGGKLNKAFFENKLINRVSITIEPYIIGRGRSFIAEGDFEEKLSLLSVDELSGGRVKLTYEVENGG